MLERASFDDAWRSCVGFYMARAIALGMRH